MSIYINIDVDPDPDCHLGSKVTIYVLYPPDSQYPLELCDEDDDYSEKLLCKLFDGYREMEGCIGSDKKLPDNVHEICAKNNITINKIGKRLGDCQ